MKRLILVFAMLTLAGELIAGAVRLSVSDYRRANEYRILQEFIAIKLNLLLFGWGTQPLS